MKSKDEKMRDRIFIISEFYYPVNTSTGYYVTEIAEYLASKKRDVNVICTNAKYHKADLSGVKKKEIINGVKINRILTATINKDNFLLRAVRLWVTSFQLLFKILFLVNKGDKVLVVTNPAFLILLMPIVKLFKGINYSILVHDVFPENLIAIGKLRNDSIVSKQLREIFNWAYSKAINCIVLGRDMKEVVLRKVSKKIPVEIITNWADLNNVKPLLKNETKLVNELKLADKFVFQFAGNLGAAQGLKNVLNAIKKVKNKQLHFLFIGSGAMEAELRDFANDSPLRNITMVGFQNKEEQQYFLNACDVAIVTLNEGMLGLGVPSKSYNIMAAGKPILVVADEKSEISLMVKEHKIGWVVPPNEPGVLAGYFEKIYCDFQQDIVELNDPRSIAENYFSKELILEKYHSFFND